MELFRIFAVGLILSAVVVATAVAPLTSAVGPTSDPPNADVIPNFSGLNVSGDVDIQGKLKNPTTCPPMQICTTDLYIDDNVSINGALKLKPQSSWNMHLEGVEFKANPSDNLIINGDVEILGNLKTEQMGKIYQKSASRSVANNSYNNQPIYCDSGDWSLGCYGGFDPSVVGTTEAGIIGIKPITSGAYQGCNVAAWNKTGSAKTMYAYVSCMATDNNWAG